MEIALQWNCDPSDAANKELIANNIRSEIKDSFRMMDLEADTVVASINHDPYSSTLVGCVTEGTEVLCTFTYSLSSGHSATYKKVT